MTQAFTLRPYRDDDFESSVALWLKSWTATYPDIDFNQRVSWWRNRWLHELLPVCEVTVAIDTSQQLIGFVTLTPATGYLDQIVVDPEQQGAGVALALLNYCKKRCPEKIELHVNQTNPRAIRFYEREGFKIIGESINPRSKLPIYEMRWQN